MKEIWRRLLWLARRKQFDRELEEEMRIHLEMQAEQLGSLESAHRQFGNVTLLKEESRAMWTGPFWERIAQDVRYGLRAMASNKLFTAIAVLSLALGIGANTAIYSFMDAIMLRAMPVSHPEQLAIVNWRGPRDAGVVHNHNGSSYRDGEHGTTSPDFPFGAYEFLRDNSQVFSTLFAHAGAGRLNLVVDGQAELGNGEYVSGGYLAGLGIRTAAGRLIGPDDDRPGAPPVVAISYGLWERRFARSADAIGKTITLNGHPFVVIGVTAPDFFGVNPGRVPVVLIPLRDVRFVDLNRYGDAEARYADKNSYWVELMGRLKPGVSLQQAETALRVQFQQWVTATAKTDKERATLPTLWLQEGGSGVDSLRRQYSKPLYILMTMVALILTIACANIANLLLARAVSRRREMAVRLSLGAARARVIQQLLTESVLISLCGAVLGVAVAAAGIRFLTWLLANGRDNFTLYAALDLRVLTFTLVVALATGILFGLAPAIQATKVDVIPALKETRAGGLPGRWRRFGLSQTLVAAQIAISLLLVAGAGLFVRSLGNLHAVNIGFNRENLLLFGLNPTQAGYKDAALKNFYASMQRRFRTMPGVRNVTMSQMPLVTQRMWTNTLTIPGYSQTDGKPPFTAVAQVGPEFFSTMEIPILLGRPIDERDRDGGPVTAVVSETFANKYFPGVPPIGRHFGWGNGKTGPPEDVVIVGLAKTAHYSSLKGEIPPVVYTSYQQTSKNRTLGEMYFEVRAAGDPMALANTVRQIVHDAAPQVPVAEMGTHAKKIDETIVQERMFANLCSCFAGLALVMACVGLYGTMAYAVTRRTSEIGIRMALGAARRGIVWMVLRDVLALGIVGLTIGLGAVWETTTFVKSFLFGLTPNDPLTVLGAVAVLIVCALLAGYAPAWRASKIDPMTALRYE
jgi:predicted permease